MDASTAPTTPCPLTVQACLAIVLLALLAHLLTLTITTGLCVAHLATCPLWHALAWSLLLGGWIGAIMLLDWGFCWYFIASILSHSRPPPHHSISLGVFSTPAQVAHTLSSTTTELHITYTAPSQEPLNPSTQLPYHHAHDPTAPIPYYDPTTRAQHEWARSWAQKPASPPAHDASALVCHESEEGLA